MAIVLETTIGDMTIDLFTDIRPITCKNFLKLCKMKYYNFNLFHTVQSNFIAQTGDPTGSGNGGESALSFVNGPDAKYITGEKLPKVKHTKPGLVSMVNCGNQLIGSQFFITLGPDLDSLNEHIVFGEVAEGHEILLKLNETICDMENHPYQDIRITHTVILEDPFDDIEGLLIPPNSPEPNEEILRTDRIAADEEIEDESKFSAAQLQEMKAEQEAKAQATILEIVGDIPDADIAPPENVLFVCKLNPVTTDEDLEIIFSRFGKINSCEVIRDKDSGDSLQYAFIEFDERKSCEDAYLKMDNVLIDDRRIHVDFSQSVSKMRWRGKGRGVEYFNKDSKSKENSNNYTNRRTEPEKYNRKESKHYHPKERSRHSSNSPERRRRRSKSRSRHSSDSPERPRRRSRSRDRQKPRNKTRYLSRSRSRHRERSRSRHRSRSRSRNYSTSRQKYHNSSRSRGSRSSRDHYKGKYSRH